MKDNLESVNLPVVPCALKVAVTRDIQWNSFPGGVIHGVLGFSLKTLTCVAPDRNCKKCYLVHSCPYGVIYESPLPPGSKRMRLYPQTPHPIKVTVYPWDVRSTIKGGNFEIRITLLGKASNYLLMVLTALETALSKGVGRKHNSERGHGEITTVQDMKTGVARGWDELKANYSQAVMCHDLKKLGAIDGDRDIHLAFTSPLKLITDGKVNHKPTLRDLTANLLRRIGNLSYFFSGKEWETDWAGLLEMAERAEYTTDLKKIRAVRYSSRQKTTISVGGLIGNFCVSNCPSEIVSLFLAGQYIGLGKGTTIGLGDYSIQVI